MTTSPLDGLYLVTDAELCRDRGIVAMVAAALEGGVSVLQYRDKDTDRTRRLREATELAALCRRHAAVFLVNDDIELAAAAGADGVHLGKDDAGLALARESLGEHAIIGVSCYNEITRARDAAAAGADYVAFGSMFASAVKPSAPRADLALVTQAKRELDLPVCTIGGIDAGNIASLATAGADMFAVITALLGSDDPRAAASELVATIRDARASTP